MIKHEAPMLSFDSPFNGYLSQIGALRGLRVINSTSDNHAYVAQVLKY